MSFESLGRTLGHAFVCFKVGPVREDKMMTSIWVLEMYRSKVAGHLHCTRTVF